MKKSLFIISLIALGLIVVAPKNYALDAVDEEIGEELKLYLGEAKLLSVSNPTRIVIGNPAVVDVTHVTNSEITLSPKGTGTTTLVIWDNFGEQSFRARVFAEDMNEVKRRIDNMLEKLNLPEVYTKAEEQEGKVVLLGRVKTAFDKERIAIALGPSLKEKTTDLIEIKEEEAVIEIDVQVLELDRGATETLGFTWPSSVTLTDVSGPTTTGTTGLTKIFHVSDFTRSAFNLTLDALIHEGKARLLSRPRLACQSGKEAKLMVGGEVPILSAAPGTTATGTTGNVEYKEYGIILNIRPKVDVSQRRIHINLNIDVSEIDQTIGAIETTYAKAFPFTKRSASTELFLNDGQTLAIGGLIKRRTEEDLRKFPWLADLPVLGLFFRHKDSKTGGGSGIRGDTELFITLTPKIVSKEMPAEAKARKDFAKKITPAQETLSFQAAGIPANLANYVRAVQTKITHVLYYPPQAKEAGWGGNVKLNLNLTSNGSLKDIKILESSGYKILDDAALEVAKNQAPYPPFPPQIESEEIWIVVPVVYKTD